MAEAPAIDRKRLEKELASAIEDEERRLRVDEMKKRAIMSARSYDEFKGLVACANQKPVSRKDMDGLTSMRPAVVLNPVTRGAAGAGVDGVAAAAAADALAGGEGPDALPRTLADFDRYWRRVATTPTARFQLLLALPPKRISKLFAGELDSALLFQWVASVREHLAPARRKECRRITRALTALLQSRAAPLALAFANAAEKETLLSVVRDLAAVEACHGRELDTLRACVEQHCA